MKGQVAASLVPSTGTVLMQAGSSGVNDPLVQHRGQGAFPESILTGCRGNAPTRHIQPPLHFAMLKHFFFPHKMIPEQMII